MSAVVTDISMSLDGYVTGPGPDLEHGLGHGGETIQQWVFASHDAPADRAFLERADEKTGAVIMGRRTFDFVDGPHGWNQEISYAYDHPTTSMPPIFVVTHHKPARTRLSSGFSFVTDGIESVISQARDVAGNKEVVVMGGAETIARAITTRMVDQVRIHLSPVLMGSGTRLFELIDERIQLTQVHAVVTPNATHLTYQIASE